MRLNGMAVYFLLAYREALSLAAGVLRDSAAASAPQAPLSRRYAHRATCLVFRSDSLARPGFARPRLSCSGLDVRLVQRSEVLDQHSNKVTDLDPVLIIHEYSR
jgi:hypothetical protein